MPRRSAALQCCFRSWVPGYLTRHFHAVRLSRCCRPVVAPELPLIVVLNHPAWWDPLVALILSGRFPAQHHYAPMEARALARYVLFNRLGFYAVEQGTTRGAEGFLLTTAAILAEPRTAVWITAQGRFTDPRVRPPGVLPGVGHVARRLRDGLILPLALEYPFWGERLPEALAYFGKPLRIRDHAGLSAKQWTARIDDRLATTQDALAVEALARDPAAFETLVNGNAGVGGLYDQWRRLRAWRAGEPFQAAHGAEGNTP